MNASFTHILGLFNLGPTELIVILVILLLLFGGSKLPSLARGLGQSIKEFKKSSKEGTEDEDKPAASETKVASAKPADPAANDPHRSASETRSPTSRHVERAMLRDDFREWTYGYICNARVLKLQPLHCADGAPRR